MERKKKKIASKIFSVVAIGLFIIPLFFVAFTRVEYYITTQNALNDAAQTSETNDNTEATDEKSEETEEK